MARTDPGHIEAAGGSVQFDDDRNATDMHHLVIAALNDSYTLFQPGELPTSGHAAALITQTVAGAFRIGVQLSAPFIVFGPPVDPRRAIAPAAASRRDNEFLSRLCRQRAARADAARLEHDPEKWEPVFRKDHALAIEHDPEKWEPVFRKDHALAIEHDLEKWDRISEKIMLRQ
jgi:hypothetical protein